MMSQRPPGVVISPASLRGPAPSFVVRAHEQDVVSRGRESPLTRTRAVSSWPAARPIRVDGAGVVDADVAAGHSVYDVYTCAEIQASFQVQPRSSASSPFIDAPFLLRRRLADADAFRVLLVPAGSHLRRCCNDLQA